MQSSWGLIQYISSLFGEEAELSNTKGQLGTKKVFYNTQGPDSI